MTRQEVTYVRPLDFSKWIRTMLPDSSTGYSASDLDFVLWNWKTKKVMLLEIKTRNGECRPGQRRMWSMLHKWIQKALIDEEWKYLGFHLVQFENTSFHDGKIFLNRVPTTERDLAKFLSF